MGPIATLHVYFIRVTAWPGLSAPTTHIEKYCEPPP